MGHIFISYAREDEKAVDELIARLTGRGAMVWVDRSNIPGGKLWRESIVDAISTCTEFLLVISPGSMASDNVRKELDLATDEGKPLIPLLLAPAKIPAGMKYQLAGIQTIDLAAQDGFERLAAALGLGKGPASRGGPKESAAKPPVSPEKAGADPRATQTVPKAAPPSPAPDRLVVGEMEFCPIPAGKFLMGSREDDKDAMDNERPLHILDLAYDYWLGRCQVTNAQYALFVQQEKLEHPVADWQKKSDHPVVLVLWYTSRRFCDWFNLRYASLMPPRLRADLPSEAEWEKAARGVEGRLYPWGEAAPTRELCNIFYWFYDTTPVMNFSPRGDSPYGCTDMAGNVRVWTRSNFEKYPYQPTDGREGLIKLPAFRVLRGGSFNDGGGNARCAYRNNAPPNRIHNNTGFRVVLRPTLPSER